MYNPGIRFEIRRISQNKLRSIWDLKFLGRQFWDVHGHIHNTAIFAYFYSTVKDYINHYDADII